MIKRASVIAVLVALIIGGVTCLGFGAMSFRVYGGYSMLNPTAYNDYMKGQADGWVAWGGGSASVDKLSSAIPLGVDVRYGKNPGLVFSLGLTRFGGGKAGYDWTSILGIYSLKREDTISATGVLGSVVYVLENGIYFGGGPGYYMVELKKTLPSDVWGLEYAYTAERNQLGFHVQGGYQYPLTQNVALGVEVLYRMLTLADMTYRRHDNPAWVGNTWVNEVNLSGINMMLAIIILLA